MNTQTLYIFIDEAGNFDFSSNGTKYFVLTAITTTSPLQNREKLFQLKYKTLSSGINQEYFHATEDQQAIRNEVFNIMNGIRDFSVDSIIAQKNKANPSLYIETYMKKEKKISKTTGAEFYRIICQTLLQYIFRRFQMSSISRVIVVLDNLFTDSKRQFVLKSLKTYLKQHFLKQFYIYFHQSKADINCQIADYCGWAIYVKNERKEMRPIQQIKGKIKSEFHLFQRGLTEYYAKNN
ncbi:MAG: hypothetical protein A2804_00325 [Candidatus Pacebacteria bacterium RIFCSPHIGHO2_01_FULL_46_10]|nr:MAG: hypothetical protein A2804_00325 [Candidatus Pacebacteria bacterium RIFCSPHIGHO2_01_FULL_46_10]